MLVLNGRADITYIEVVTINLRWVLPPWYLTVKFSFPIREESATLSQIGSHALSALKLQRRHHDPQYAGLSSMCGAA